MEKTNAMRIAEKAGVTFRTYTYDSKGAFLDGVSVAQKIGKDAAQVFKTLVAAGHSKAYYVFVIPVAAELDLKAAARAVGEKSVEMIKVADITKVTGYIRGGCSPIGMKKSYATVLDASCARQETMIFSAGKIGLQMEIKPNELAGLANAAMADITHKI